LLNKLHPRYQVQQQQQQTQEQQHLSFNAKWKSNKKEMKFMKAQPRNYTFVENLEKENLKLNCFLQSKKNSLVQAV